MEWTIRWTVEWGMSAGWGPEVPGVPGDGFGAEIAVSIGVSDGCGGMGAERAALSRIALFLA